MISLDSDDSDYEELIAEKPTWSARTEFAQRKGKMLVMVPAEEEHPDAESIEVYGRRFGVVHTQLQRTLRGDPQAYSFKLDQRLPEHLGPDCLVKVFCKK